MERRSLARLMDRVLRRVGTAMLGLGVAMSAAGCRHKAKPLVLPVAARAPIELEPIPPADPLPMIASVPAPELGPLPPPPSPPRRRRVPPAPATAPPPAQVASAAEPAAVAIGALSTGEDATTQSQQEVKDLMASIVKRIAALPAKTADAQKTQVRQVKQFLEQAQQALDSGDADGAKNLATKAKLLMDDVEKE
jgi:hypothetical protein